MAGQEMCERYSYQWKRAYAYPDSQSMLWGLQSNDTLSKELSKWLEFDLVKSLLISRLDSKVLWVSGP